MQKVLSFLLVFGILGCASSVPKDTAKISNKIIIEHDKFKDLTHIETELYLSRQGFTDTFPVRLKYRAIYRSNLLETLQLYVISSNVTWGFYHSAFGVDAQELKFIKIDGLVDSSSGMVSTEEHYSLEIPKSYLEKMAGKDWEIKVYGKRNEGVFIVPATLSRTFIEKLNCFESKKCEV